MLRPLLVAAWAVGLTGCASLESEMAAAAIEAQLDELASARAREVQYSGVDLRLLRDARIGPNRVAVLRDDLYYCYPPTRELIVVPRGYLTDFASVPGGAHLMVERYGDNIEAAIVHDWLYAVGEPNRRAWADDVFRYALQEQNVGLLSRYAAFVGVKAGGEEAYGHEREWADHFFDVETMQATPPRMKKPTSPVREVLSTCDALETPAELESLKRRHDSSTWPS